MGHQEDRRGQHVDEEAEEVERTRRRRRAGRAARTEYFPVGTTEIARASATGVFLAAAFPAAVSSRRARVRRSTSTRKAKTERQPKKVCSQPPMSGATAGASANIMVICAIRRWASAPSNRSRTMARLMTMPAPAVMPCMARQNHNCSMLVAKAQPAEAIPNRASASENDPASAETVGNGAMPQGHHRKGEQDRRTASAALRAGWRRASLRCRGRTAGRCRSRTARVPTTKPAGARCRAARPSFQSWARRRYWMASAIGAVRGCSRWRRGRQWSGRLSGCGARPGPRGRAGRSPG